MRNKGLKRLGVILLATSIFLSGCGREQVQQKDWLEDWLKEANLDAEETPETLYAAALKEDILVVHSTSTRMIEVGESFEKQYPGLTVKVDHMRAPDLCDKLLSDYESGDIQCDVISIADGTGTISREFVPKNIVVKYVPYDIEDLVLPGNNESLLAYVGEAGMFSYNENYYAESPIKNWWELTEEKWRGLVYMPNPMRSVTTLAFFCMIIENSDMMAKSYEDLYGQVLELPEGESAGRAFIRMLIENDAIIVNASDEMAEEIGRPGSHSPAVGIMVSSKIRLKDIGYEMVIDYDLEPFCGVYIPVNVMLVGGAKNINTAKLFIRWLLGETDGQGDGYKPFLKSGAWTVRSDVQDDTGVRSEDLDLLYLDYSYMYENQEAFLTFWEELIENRK